MNPKIQIQKLVTPEYIERWTRGVVIASTRRIAKSRDGGYAYVQSQYDDKTYYRVDENGNCECPDSQHRKGVICKHVFSIIAKEVLK